MAVSAVNPNLAAASKATRRFDLVDGDLVLRNISDGAETTNAAETAVKFDAEKQGPYALIINSSGSSGTVDGSNFFTVTAEVADNVGFTNPTTVFSTALGDAAEEFYIALDGYMLETIRTAGEDASIYMRTRLTETGTTATDATYGAYLTAS